MLAQTSFAYKNYKIIENIIILALIETRIICLNYKIIENIKKVESTQPWQSEYNSNSNKNINFSHMHGAITINKCESCDLITRPSPSMNGWKGGNVV